MNSFEVVKENRTEFDNLLIDLIFRSPQNSFLKEALTCLKQDFDSFDKSIDSFLSKKSFLNEKSHNQDHLDMWNAVSSFKSDKIDILEDFYRSCEQIFQKYERDSKQIQNIKTDLVLLGNEKSSIDSRKFALKEAKLIEDRNKEDNLNQIDLKLMEEETKLADFEKQKKICLDEIKNSEAVLLANINSNLANHPNESEFESEQNPYIEEKKEIEYQFQQKLNQIISQLGEYENKLNDAKLRKNRNDISSCQMKYENQNKMKKETEKNYENQIKSVNQKIESYSLILTQTSQEIFDVVQDTNSFIEKVNAEDQQKNEEKLNLLRLKLNSFENQLKKSNDILQLLNISKKNLLQQNLPSRNQKSEEISEKTLESKIQKLEADKKKILEENGFLIEEIFLNFKNILNEGLLLIRNRIFQLKEVQINLTTMKSAYDEQRNI